MRSPASIFFSVAGRTLTCFAGELRCSATGQDHRNGHQGLPQELVRTLWGAVVSPEMLEKLESGHIVIVIIRMWNLKECRPRRRQPRPSGRLDAIAEESTSEDDVQANQTPMDATVEPMVVDSAREPSSADPGSTAGSDARSISNDFEAERSSGRRFRWIISIWTSSKNGSSGQRPGRNRILFHRIHRGHLL